MFHSKDYKISQMLVTILVFLDFTKDHAVTNEMEGRTEGSNDGLCYTSRGALARMRNSSVGLIRRPIAP